MIDKLRGSLLPVLGVSAVGCVEAGLARVGGSAWSAGPLSLGSHSPCLGGLLLGDGDQVYHQWLVLEAIVVLLVKGCRFVKILSWDLSHARHSKFLVFGGFEATGRVHDSRAV